MTIDWQKKNVTETKEVPVFWGSLYCKYNKKGL